LFLIYNKKETMFFKKYLNLFDILTLSIGILFLFINALTITWGNLPWLDEVMLIDSPINFVLDGEWYTTSWLSRGSENPISTYPPLYQILLVPWVYAFGVSPLAVRSLNLVLTLVISFLLVRYLKKNNYLTKVWVLISFLLVFWSSYTFSWIYRSGRVDITNLLAVLYFVYSYFRFSILSKGKLHIFFSAFLVAISGFQAIPFLVLFLIWAYIFDNKSKIIKLKILKLSIISWSTALVGLSLFFFMNGGLFSFMVSLVSYSSSFKKLAVILLPYVGDYLQLDVDAWISRAMDDGPGLTLIQKLVEAFIYHKTYLILTIFNLLGAITLQSKMGFEKIKTIWIVFGFSIFVPLFMILAGRFQIYYSWMAFIPSLITSVFIIEKTHTIWVKLFYMAVTASVLVLGLPNHLINANKDQYKNLTVFVNNLEVDWKKEIVLPTYRCYYLVRNKTNQLYFIHNFPIEKIPSDPSLIIIDNDDKHSVEELIDYKNTNVFQDGRFELFKSLENPEINVYKKKSGD